MARGAQHLGSRHAASATHGRGWHSTPRAREAAAARRRAHGDGLRSRPSQRRRRFSSAEEMLSPRWHCFVVSFLEFWLVQAFPRARRYSVALNLPSVVSSSADSLTGGTQAIAFCHRGRGILESGSNRTPQHTTSEQGQPTSRHTNRRAHAQYTTSHPVPSRSPKHPVLTVNPHPRKHPARSSSPPCSLRGAPGGYCTGRSIPEGLCGGRLESGFNPALDFGSIARGA